jgi:hypothetical protein
VPRFDGALFKIRENKMEEKLHSSIDKVVFGIFLSAIGLCMIINSRTFPKVRAGEQVMTGPSFFPTIIGILMIIFGIYTIIANLLSREVGLKDLKKINLSFFKSFEFLNFFIIVFFIFMYPTIIETLGFYLGTFLFCIILMKRLKVKWINAILSSLILVIFTWIVFGGIAFISFPIGIIFSW